MLQQWCDPNAHAGNVMLRKVLLDLYTKSGWNDILSPAVYADTANNTKSVHAPSVTILGESTPETFFDGLDAGHINEGLIPRFTIVQYDGERVPRNLSANCPPLPGLVDRFSELVTVALTTMQNNTCEIVTIESKAQGLLDAFDLEADKQINDSRQDVVAQIWNRAHLKALKLSALLAVGVDPHRPIVEMREAEWSIEFVRRDVEVMTSRYASGDVGTGDSKLIADLRRVIQRYFEMAKDQLVKAGISEKMQKDGIVPHSFLVTRTSNLSAYKKDRRGATGALKAVIQSLEDSDKLVPVHSNQCKERYNVGGKNWLCRRI
jgi:hypothetical protein